MSYQVTFNFDSKDAAGRMLGWFEGGGYEDYVSFVEEVWGIDVEIGNIDIDNLTVDISEKDLSIKQKYVNEDVEENDDQPYEGLDED